MKSSMYLKAIIVTEDIIANTPSPSQDPENPTRISLDDVFVVAMSQSLTGSAVEELALHARIGSRVKISAVTESDCFENSVLLYELSPVKGEGNLKPLGTREYVASAITPSGKDVLPGTVVDDQEFWFLDTVVAHHGATWYKWSFAVFCTNEDGNPEPLGYFQWVSQLTIEHRIPVEELN